MSTSRAGAERRIEPRYEVDRDVTIEISGSHLQGHLTDVSDHGAYVTLSIDVEVGTEVVLALSDKPVQAAAEVRRLGAGGFAIQFDQETVGMIMREAAENATKVHD
ncbi:MAG: PilZ domain-containing protein [Alphaproteobacteria bacterium]|jgi:hypothetical protein|nr:PilZ domain-containing protein [Alphaproteobacteria bacterium]